MEFTSPFTSLHLFTYYIFNGPIVFVSLHLIIYIRWGIINHNKTCLWGLVVMVKPFMVLYYSLIKHNKTYIEGIL